VHLTGRNNGNNRQATIEIQPRVFFNHEATTKINNRQEPKIRTSSPSSWSRVS